MTHTPKRAEIVEDGEASMKELVPAIYIRMMEHAISHMIADVENCFSYFLESYEDT